jgi:hypothetical protein
MGFVHQPCIPVVPLFTHLLALAQSHMPISELSSSSSYMQSPLEVDNWFRFYIAPPEVTPKDQDSTFQQAWVVDHVSDSNYFNCPAFCYYEDGTSFFTAMKAPYPSRSDYHSPIYDPPSLAELISYQAALVQRSDVKLNYNYGPSNAVYEAPPMTSLLVPSPLLSVSQKSSHPNWADHRSSESDLTRQADDKQPVLCGVSTIFFLFLLFSARG